MNIQQLNYFIALAENEHMTKTAQDLNISQPSLSYTISELEKELGVPLFKKTGRNIRLTKYGNYYYQYVRQALKLLSQAKKTISDDIHPSVGKIDFGFIYTMGAVNAPQVTKTFLEANPDVRFSFKQNNSNNLLQDLRDEILDVVFVSHVEGYEDIHFEPLLTEKIIVAAPLQHPISQKDLISLEELAEHNLVYYNHSSGLRSYLDQLFQEAHLTISSNIEVEDDQTVLGFVSRGFGLAIMPDIPTIKAFPVKTLKISNPINPRIIYLATRKNAYLSPTLKKFKAFCLSYFNSDKAKKTSKY